MSRSHSFYFKATVSELETLMEAHQTEFDHLLDDLFTEEELAFFEKQIDSIAAVYVQPILSELSFDDFYADAAKEEAQREFFESARSSICFENLPYFESNPFQVSYLKLLLNQVSEALIDQGGVSELVFKEDYLKLLSAHKDMDAFIPKETKKPIEVKTKRPVDPIDFLILDVYKEIDRLKNSGIKIDISEQGERTRKIIKVMSHEKLDASELLRKSGLGAKEFDDGLERVKFWLRKL